MRRQRDCVPYSGRACTSKNQQFLFQEFFPNLIFSAIESSGEENCSPFWLVSGLFLCFSSEKLAYTTLISAVYQTAKLGLFVGTEVLLTSWKVWTHLLDSLNNKIPQQYVPENLEVLEFTTLGERLEFSWKNDKLRELVIMVESVSQLGRQLTITNLTCLEIITQ